MKFDDPHPFEPRFDLKGRAPEEDDECGICNMVFCTDIHQFNVPPIIDPPPYDWGQS